jgi:hypothetical protein
MEHCAISSRQNARKRNTYASEYTRSHAAIPAELAASTAGETHRFLIAKLAADRTSVVVRSGTGFLIHWREPIKLLNAANSVTSMSSDYLTVLMFRRLDFESERHKQILTMRVVQISSL